MTRIQGLVQVLAIPEGELRAPVEPGVRVGDRPTTDSPHAMPWRADDAGSQFGRCDNFTSIAASRADWYSA